MEGQGEKQRDDSMEKILRRMKKLATVPVNDAVKLAFLDGEQVEEIDRLDLTALTEFKRNAGGTVEIKLIDRMAALEKIAGLISAQREDDAADFFRALEENRGAEE